MVNTTAFVTSTQFRPLHVPRVRATTPYFEQALEFFDKNPSQRFTSDGDRRSHDSGFSQGRVELESPLSLQSTDSLSYLTG